MDNDYVSFERVKNFSVFIAEKRFNIYIKLCNIANAWWNCYLLRDFDLKNFNKISNYSAVTRRNLSDIHGDGDYVRNIGIPSLKALRKIEIKMIRHITQTSSMRLFPSRLIAARFFKVNYPPSLAAR